MEECVDSDLQMASAASAGEFWVSWQPSPPHAGPGRRTQDLHVLLSCQVRQSGHVLRGRLPVAGKQSWSTGRPSPCQDSSSLLLRLCPPPLFSSCVLRFHVCQTRRIAVRRVPQLPKNSREQPMFIFGHLRCCQRCCWYIMVFTTSEYPESGILLSRSVACFKLSPWTTLNHT